MFLKLSQTTYLPGNYSNISRLGKSRKSSTQVRAGDWMGYVSARWWLNFNPFEKYANRQIWTMKPQVFGMKIPKLFELPPPSEFFCSCHSYLPRWTVFASPFILHPEKAAGSRAQGLRWMSNRKLGGATHLKNMIRIGSFLCENGRKDLKPPKRPLEWHHLNKTHLFKCPKCPILELKKYLWKTKPPVSKNAGDILPPKAFRMPPPQLTTLGESPVSLGFFNPSEKVLGKFTSNLTWRIIPWLTQKGQNLKGRRQRAKFTL